MCNQNLGGKSSSKKVVALQGYEHTGKTSTLKDVMLRLLAYSSSNSIVENTEQGEPDVDMRAKMTLDKSKFEGLDRDICIIVVTAGDPSNSYLDLEWANYHRNEEPNKVALLITACRKGVGVQRTIKAIRDYYSVPNEEIDYIDKQDVALQDQFMNMQETASEVIAKAFEILGVKPK